MDHRAQLTPDEGPSAFEFRLHSLNFVHVLQSQGEKLRTLRRGDGGACARGALINETAEEETVSPWGGAPCSG